MARYYDFNGIYNKAKLLNCKNILIAGGKGNGKTYGCLKKGLELYLSTGRIIRYARRLDKTVKQDNLKNLFRPHHKLIERLTDGKYNHVTMRGRRFYLDFIENDKKIRSDKREFCIVNALSTWESDSGPDEGEACLIVFDEAISRECALKDEFTKLMKYHNNCMRNRNDYFCPLILLGNTVTRDCEIFDDFGIDLWQIADSDKGHIQIVKNRKGQINALFEWCAKAEVQEESAEEYYNRFDNDKTKMITEGVFTLGEYKHMKYDVAMKKSTQLFSIALIHPHYNLEIDYIMNQYGNLFCFVRESPAVEKCDLIVNPATMLNRGNILNVFEGRFADIFTYCYSCEQVVYESCAVGEKYRSFAMHCTGLDSCIPA